MKNLNLRIPLNIVCVAHPRHGKYYYVIYFLTINYVYRKITCPKKRPDIVKWSDHFLRLYCITVAFLWTSWIIQHQLCEIDPSQELGQAHINIHKINPTWNENCVDTA